MAYAPGQFARAVWKRRRELLASMGSLCARCGADEETSGALLEFDHPHGRSWRPNRVNQLTRVKLYRRDFEAGNLRLLCRSCNGSDGARRRHGRVSDG